MIAIHRFETAWATYRSILDQFQPEHSDRAGEANAELLAAHADLSAVNQKTKKRWSTKDLENAEQVWSRFVDKFSPPDYSGDNTIDVELDEQSSVQTVRSVGDRYPGRKRYNRTDCVVQIRTTAQDVLSMIRKNAIDGASTRAGLPLVTLAHKPLATESGLVVYQASWVRVVNKTHTEQHGVIAWCPVAQVEYHLSHAPSLNDKTLATVAIRRLRAKLKARNRTGVLTTNRQVSIRLLERATGWCHAGITQFCELYADGIKPSYSLDEARTALQRAEAAGTHAAYTPRLTRLLTNAETSL